MSVMVDMSLEVYAAQHNMCPFGATSSVYAWEHVGGLICTLANKLFGLILLRYVDDFFGTER